MKASSTIPYTIYRVYSDDRKDKRAEKYAIVSNAGGPGIVGTRADLRLLVKQIENFLQSASPLEGIHYQAEQLGQWLNIFSAVRLSRELGMPLSVATIRRACKNQRIAGAKLDGGLWRFPRAAFQQWLQSGSHRRGRPWPSHSEGDESP